LEKTSHLLHERLSKSGGAAWVSVNKALVTRASAVIPIIPLYISALFKVMKEKGLHEGCIEQLVRLYKERLYVGEAVQNPSKVPTDSERRIRIDDWEMRDDVQRETKARMEAITEENLFTLADVEGFKHDFLEAHGFDVAGVDYEADVDPSTI
ncbi:MAG: bifunctional NADH-specific enoyl-ACP reductase/trans-2-enoyl-CoA reductase, partial [Treponema sp.]|nr:bifunctional NADH-specific enoyl-ACP reductase/trans-2-enoyl-CoA reductase [Treponema sp.]